MNDQEDFVITTRDVGLEAQGAVGWRRAPAAAAPRGWIGVDLDGTLAHYTRYQGPTHIGPPVPAMVERVKRWLDAGHDVRIFTARVFDEATRADVYPAIRAWCVEHIGRELRITCVKDHAMWELWDDRAVQVIPNTGTPVGASTRGLE